jgi:hypothetical protein
MVKRALLVGINYANSSDELNGCINDVKNIRNFLISNCGYNSDNIVMITDETPIKPTFKNLQENVKSLVNNCLQGDTLFWYYSGHGSVIRDTNGDETNGQDEVIIPIDYKTAGVITDDWLFENLVAKVPKGVALWAFTDCCHSGTILDLKYNYKSNCQFKKGKVTSGMSYNPLDWTDNFLFSRERSKDIQGNVFLYSGCLDNETSADAYIAKQSQGAFSYCLMESFKANMTKMPNGTVRFKNGTLKLRHLLKNINAMLDINGYTGQQSQLSLSNSQDFEKTIDL